MKNEKNAFPYRNFESIPAWNILDQALEELKRNKDLIIQTDNRYIVGFILKEFVDKGIIKLSKTG